jgi:uncharacterized membrane protein YcaP (DUF421 family)
MFSDVQAAFNIIFGGDTPSSPLSWPQIAARAVVIYALGMLAIRVGKSRIISRVTGLDVVLAFMLGSLLSRGINGSGSLSGTLVATAALVSMHWAITYLTCRSHRLSQLLKGHIRPLVCDGRTIPENLARSHLSHDDLLSELRLNANVDDLADVKVAYKERNGEIGVVRQRSRPQIVEIRVENGVQVVRIEWAPQK